MPTRSPAASADKAFDVFGGHGPGGGEGPRPPGFRAGPPPVFPFQAGRMFAGAPDVLGEVLDGVFLRSIVPGPAEFTAPWGIRHDGGVGGFYLIREGRCWLECRGVGAGQGEATGMWLEAGDLAVVTRGVGHRGDSPTASGTPGGHTLSDRPGTPTRDVRELITPEVMLRRATLRHGGGGAVMRMVSGAMIFAHRGFFGPLESALPLVVRVPGQGGRPAAWAEAVLALIEMELARDAPGVAPTINRLVQVLFINAVREHAATMGAGRPGLLRALFSADVGPAIGFLHARPDLDWTVASLAQRVGVSRSVLAQRFAEEVGITPLKYLTECRMHKATSLLRTGRMGIKEIGRSVGYASEAAFSTAYKRWAGVAPGQARQATETPAD